MNYITYTDNLTTFVYVKGYNFKWTQYVLLSTTSDNTFYTASSFNPFSSYPRLSAIFPEFNGFVYTNYEVVDDNQLKVNLASISGAGKYDIITLNGAGYVKLSDKGYLVDSLSLVTQTPSQTQTPSYTPTNTQTPSFTPTQTQTPSYTPTNTQTPSFTPTQTPTLTPSITPTTTSTPTQTPTNTPSVTLTQTPTQTNTPSVTQTPSPSPVPSSWIPVATTTSVDVVQLPGGSLDGTYQKEDPTSWSPGGGDNRLIWSSLNSRWEFIGDNSYLWGYNNSSGQNPDYIPTTGSWIGQFIGTITITITIPNL